MSYKDNVSAVDVLEQDGVSEIVGTPTVTVLAVDSGKFVTYASGATVPTDADAGYAHGCVFVKTNGAVGSTLYMNEGSNTSADFNAITTSAGSGVNTWDGLYNLDKTLSINAATLTFALTHATNNGLTLTGDAASAGHVLQITNAGSGKDIRGTSGLWSISAAGALLAQSIANPTAATDLTVDAGTSGVVNIASTSTGGITLGASTTLSSAKTLTLTGSASGTAVLTLTAGDLIISDGKLAVTRVGDNANAFTVTNNSTSTVANIVLAGSGTHTGTTTASFMTLTASGLTSGTVLYIAAALLDSGKVIHITATAQTSGTLLTITGGGNNITSGVLANFDMGAATAGNGVKISSSGIYATGSSGLLNVTANSATDTTGLVQVSATGLTSGSAVLITAGGVNMLTGGKALELALGAATDGNGITVTGSGVYVGTGYAVITTGAMTTGILVSLISTTGLTSGSLLRATSSTAGQIATNGAISIRATGAFTSASNVGYVDLLASATTAGTIMRIAASAASQTATELLNILQTGATITAYTASLVTITGAFSGTSSTGSAVLITSVHTTAGDGLKIVANSLTLGAATGILVSHTTSVLGAGTSLVRISSTGIDTGTTAGVLLDLNTSAAVGSTQIMLTDSSADTAARIGFLSKVTNTAAVLAVPYKSSNVAVTGTGSKFTRHYVMTDGTKTTTIWLSQDQTTPNAALTATAGDLCLNGPSSVPYYCTGTNVWVALA